MFRGTFKLFCYILLVYCLHLPAGASNSKDDSALKRFWKNLKPLPGATAFLKPQFMKAWEAMKELSKVETVEDIDIHAIPYGKEILCKTCQLTFDFMIASHKSVVPDAALRYGFVGLCMILQTHDVCQGIISLNAPILLEILKRKPDLRADHICGTVFEQLCTTKPVVEWSIDIPAKTVSISGKKDESKSTEVFEVAHITDTHVDTKYAEGANAKGCREPLCCRDYQGTASDAKERAGLWGHYKGCDIPWATAGNLLDTVASEHKEVKYVYMTGDLIAHNIWETTKEANIKQIEEQAASFHETLGKDVKIFPVLGNHEPHPANVLAPPGIDNFSGQWLYKAFFDSWCKNFPAEAKTTFMKGGYYAVNAAPGFKVVGLNSLYSYVFNWWMILNPVDPAGQLSWLRDTLLAAESKGEKVHILMHGPVAETDTLLVWREQYNKIIDRFQSTVTGQFVGHTHRDQFYMHYSPHNKAPIAVAWNGGSVTPFTNANPNYRVYHVNKQSLEVEDFDTYSYNLTEANANPDWWPKWSKLYSFKAAYNVPSLKLGDLDKLVKKLVSDEKLFHKYFLYHMKESDVALKTGCDKKCRELQLCKIVSQAHNSTHCQLLLAA